MNEKDCRKLIKEYEKAAEKKDFPLYSFADLAEYRLKIKRAFPPENDEQKYKACLGEIGRHEAETCLYAAFRNRDMEMLNNALYVSAHVKQISNIRNPGIDHGYYGMNIIPDILAANIPDRISLLLKKEYGLSGASKTGPVLADLFMAVWFEDEELKSAALEKARKKLSQKITEYERGFIRCYAAILQNDTDGINDGLRELCRGIRTSGIPGKDFLSKGFCIEAHAVYNLSHQAFGGQLRDGIRIPDEPNFCQDLAVYQKNHGFMPGKVFNVYPPELDEYNKVLHCMPPAMHLRQEGRQRYLDTERFMNDVLKELMGQGRREEYDEQNQD